LAKKTSLNLQEHGPIKKWVIEERPREMLIEKGPAALSTAKLLAIILRTGCKGVNAEELGRRIYNYFGSLRSMDSASVQEICRIEGIGHAKAAQIMAALELGKRLIGEPSRKAARIRCADDAIHYVSERFGPYLRDINKEYFYIILLDIKNKPVHDIEISKGSVNASIVDVREIIKEATLKTASGIILIHNHPSGETEPSEEDIKLTRNLVSSCELISVKILDHIIIGKEREDYYSFAKSGLL
jgi:DNA repair protein RadC